MIKKINKLKIKIAMVIFTSIFTVINIHAMDNAPEPVYQTKGLKDLTNKSLTKLIKSIRNYEKKINDNIDKIGYASYKISDLKNSIENFDLLNQIARRQLEIIGDLEYDENQIENVNTPVIKKETFENIIYILKNTKIDNKEKNLYEKELNEKNLDNYNIFDQKNNNIDVEGFRVFKDNKEYLKKFFNELITFATHIKEKCKVILKDYKNENSEEFEITEKMVKNYKNFLKNKIKNQKYNINYKDFYNITGVNDEDQETKLDILIENVIYYGNFNENNKSIISKEQAKNITKSFSFYIDELLLKDLINFIESMRKDIKYNDNINKNKDIADKILLVYTKKNFEKKFTIKENIEETFNEFLMSELNKYEKYMNTIIKCIETNNLDVLGNVDLFLQFHKEIFEKLFLDYDNKLNKDSLALFLTNKLVDKHNCEKIIDCNVQYAEKTLQNLEYKLKTFKDKIENLSKQLEKAIIKYSMNINNTILNKTHDYIINYYEKILMMHISIFTNKISSCYNFTEKIEKFNSNNLKQLREEYKNLLDLLYVINKDTINENILLENLKKMNMIDKNVEKIEISEELKQELIKKFDLNKKLIKKLIEENFNKVFKDNKNYNNTFSAVEQEYIMQANDAPPLQEQEIDINDLIREYNYNASLEAIEKNKNIEEIKKELEETSEKIKNNDEDRTPLLNLDDKELEILNNLINKIKTNIQLEIYKEEDDEKEQNKINEQKEQNKINEQKEQNKINEQKNKKKKHKNNKKK